MAYLIDTNIAIHARDGTDAVLTRLAEHDGAVLLSALTLAELQRGIHRNASDALLRRMRLEVLLQHIPVLPFDAAAAEAYGRIIAQCGLGQGTGFRSHDRRARDQHPFRARHSQHRGLPRHSGSRDRELAGVGWSYVTPPSPAARCATGDQARRAPS